MPLFEYYCPDCDSTFEKLVRGSTTEVACPECGSTEVTKKLSTFATSIKGGRSSASISSSASCAPSG